MKRLNLFSNVNGEDRYKHAEKSAEYLGKIMKDNNIQLSEDVKNALINSIKYHHLNFSDLKAFYSGNTCCRFSINSNGYVNSAINRIKTGEIK